MKTIDTHKHTQNPFSNTPPDVKWDNLPDIGLYNVYNARIFEGSQTCKVCKLQFKLETHGINWNKSFIWRLLIY